MRDLGTNVHDSRSSGYGIHVFGKRLPFPFESFRKNGPRNIFDTFHQFHHPFTLMDMRGRKANTAIAHDRRGHAMP